MRRRRAMVRLRTNMARPRDGAGPVVSRIPNACNPVTLQAPPDVVSQNGLPVRFCDTTCPADQASARGGLETRRNFRGVCARGADVLVHPSSALSKIAPTPRGGPRQPKSAPPTLGLARV